MTGSVQLSCDVPAFVDGQNVGTCATRSTWSVKTVDEARAVAALAGWRRMAAGSGGGDRCPGHGR